MNPKIEEIRCTRCKKILIPEKTMWLELDSKTGLYHCAIPKSGISQGMFPFGQDCESKQLQETMKVKGRFQ